MSESLVPPLPGVDPASAPHLEDAGYWDWAERVLFSAEGVDRASIWASLHRTPAERLALLEEAVKTVLELRGGRWPELR